ncbi:MAG TPA: cytochrome c maturation protein CcmE [Burkholderiales bacterium]|nr:cytochrome c maturation protein CcmE [Burkholderiales bacterium]
MIGSSHESRITSHGLAAALVLAAALALSGCDYLPFGYTPIKEIVATPGPFEGKEVRIKGTARNPLQLLDLRTFTVQDETGEIVVTTAGSLPAAGAEVVVKGIVKSAIIVSGKSLGLRVEETARLR